MFEFMTALAMKKKKTVVKSQKGREERRMSQRGGCREGGEPERWASVGQFPVSYTWA